MDWTESSESASTLPVLVLKEAFAVDISSLGEAQTLPVPELSLLERADDLAALLDALSQAG